jgi:RHH-type proline utilization regulon transcriptional repressor/proline dehydrogenase/delta 1-pyrroline-5-carboxylate dehydrogenase
MRQALADVRRHFGGDYPLLVAGREVHTRAWYESVNPANPREVVGRVAQASAADVGRAVEAARSAFAEWRAHEASERAALLTRVAGLMEKQRFELAAWVCLECGKGWREADGDVAEAIDYCNYYAREMLRIASRPGVRNVPGESNVSAYRPRGVVGVVSPFNFPLALLTNMTAAAVVTGNTAVLKPAPAGSVVAAQFVDLFEQAGAPPGVVNYLPGTGEVAGEALVAHPGVAMIAFTGSPTVGCRVYANAAELRPGQQAVKRVTLDMGGNNAVIVDADADLDAAARGIIESAFGYSGQKCSACSRAIVLDEVYRAFLERLVDVCRSLAIGPPEEPGTVVGPVIDREAVERVQKYVALGQQEARLAFQGETSAVKGTGGYYVPPTILADVPPNARIANEEVFGPVLAVIRAADFGEAVRIANATPYALCGGVYTRSPANIERARRDLEVGNLYINRKISGSMVDRQPFGGYRLSGLGTKFGGPDYLIQFCVTRTVTENTLRHGVASDSAPQPAAATH